MGVLEVFAADDREGPRAVGVIVAVIVSVVHAAVEHAGIAPVAERRPAEIEVIPPPVDPGRAPHVHGDPVPAEVGAPVPAAVMGRGPAPGLVGPPGPTGKGQPAPAAVVIGAPVLVDPAGDPDVAVRGEIRPLAVLVELAFEIGELLGKLAVGEFPPGDGGAGFVELVEGVVGDGDEARRLRGEPALGDLEPLGRLEERRAVFAGGLDEALEDLDLGVPVLADVDPVDAAVEDVERGVGRVELDRLSPSSALPTVR